MAGAPEGNTNASKDKRVISSALNRAVTQNPDKLKRACEKVLEEAEQGNLSALAFIADRLEGKPAQAIVGDPDLPPVQVTGKINLVKPRD